MSESGDYNPGPWTGHDFKEARKSYDAHAGRSYEDALTSRRQGKDLVVKSLKTNSESPVVIACDVTGSMGEWPAVIFSKLPYLDLEGKEYLGKTMEISFCAVGDVYSDKYPLQIRPFASGTDMKKRLEELVIEGGGGPGTNESYDLAALYYSRNVEMPHAIHPLFVFIGDEGFYDFVDSERAKEWTGISFEKRMPTKKIIEDLQKKYSVYLIRKPYEMSGGNSMSETDRVIQKQWQDVLGIEHMAILPQPDRVVDVIFGIMAKETSRIGYFREEITGRQIDLDKPEEGIVKVKQAYESLHTIHGSVPRIKLPDSARPQDTKSLL
ncbi:MAG TPA: hypothetical protein VJA86_03105 [Candidatus Nanoarchaeia archaeon]|nr:hypothetical protein [Candidatus Nanoarchaeia archaeon]